MKKINEIQILIEGQRRRMHMTQKEVAVATVGSLGTWHKRMKDPLSFRFFEAHLLFNYLSFNRDQVDKFNSEMKKLGEELL